MTGAIVARTVSRGIRVAACVACSVFGVETEEGFAETVSPSSEIVAAASAADAAQGGSAPPEEAAEGGEGAGAPTDGATFVGKVHGGTRVNEGKPPWEHLESAIRSMERHAANPVISARTGDWKDSQVNDPVILVDPEDPSRLIMYLTGMAAPVNYGNMTVGRFTASVDDPFTWTPYEGNPVFRMTPGSWDDCSSGIRVGSVIYHGGVYYLYYMAYSGNFRVGLATSTDGVNFAPYGDAPIVQASGDEETCENPAVFKYRDTWYLYYQYRRGGYQAGIRVATSRDGYTWTKLPGDVLSAGGGTPYDAGGVEWHQVFKLGDDIVLLYECYDGGSFQLAMARSSDPTGPFVKSSSNPVLTASGIPGAFDRYHVATGGLHRIADSWYLFYQGASDGTSSYVDSRWDLGVATFPVMVKDEE